MKGKSKRATGERLIDLDKKIRKILSDRRPRTSNDLARLTGVDRTHMTGYLGALTDLDKHPNGPKHYVAVAKLPPRFYVYYMRDRAYD